ncbi:MAG: MATE family efflux transporter [Planctomycetaceae bacterium]
MCEPPAESPNRVIEGDLRRTVLWLALPALAEQFLIFCVGFVDSWLSGTISRDATSAVGTGAYIGWLASLLCGMVGAGTTALVSRYRGQREFADANRVANRSIALAAVMGVAICVLFYSAAPLLAGFLQMHGEQYRICVRYLRIDAFGHLAFSFAVIGSAALRGAGDTRSPMIVLGVVSAMNIVLSPMLVFGWAGLPIMGVDGIVTGTVIARVSGGLLMLAALTVGRSGLKLVLRELMIRGDVVRRILRIGIPAAVDGLLIWSAQVFFLRIINTISRQQPGVFAAHMIGIQMETITYLPAVAWGYAAATLVGQSLGAEDSPRARQAGHEAARQCGLPAAVISVVFFFAAQTIYATMHKDAAVHAAGVPAFQMNALFQIPLMMSIVYLFALRGAGDTRTPMIVNVLGVFGIRVPMAYLCGIVLGMQLMGAWIGMIADVSFRAALLWRRYSRGRWTRTQV